MMGRVDVIGTEIRMYQVPFQEILSEKDHPDG